MAKNRRITRQDNQMKIIEEYLRRKVMRRLPCRPHPMDEPRFSLGGSSYSSQPITTVITIPLNNTYSAIQAGFYPQGGTFDNFPGVRAGSGPDGGDCLRVQTDSQGFHGIRIASFMPNDFGQFSVRVKGFNGGVSTEDDEYVLIVYNFLNSSTPIPVPSFLIRWEYDIEELRFYPDYSNYPTTYVKIELAEADWQEEDWHQIKATWSYQTQEWSLFWDDVEGTLVTPITPDLVPWPIFVDGTQFDVFTDELGEHCIYHDVSYITTGPLQEAGIAGNDEKVKVSAVDTTADYLSDKLTSGTGITLATVNPGGDEQVQISTVITQYTDEQAQDAVGGILTDSDTIDFTYDDGANTITATVKVDSINDTMIDWGSGANQVDTDDIPEGSAKFDTYNVKVSADDTTPGILNGKLTAGSGVAFSELGGGGNETLSISNSLPNINKGHFFAQQAAAITASAYAYMGPTQYSATIGNLMIRAGSITGISASGRITGTTPTCNVRVYKNGVYLTGAEVQITDLDGDVYATFAAGTYTFAAGDELQVYLVIAGTLATLTNLMVDVEYTET